MAGIGNRKPYWLKGYPYGAGFEKLSKADWADLFCDLWIETQSGGGLELDDLRKALMSDAERRLGILKANGLR